MLPTPSTSHVDTERVYEPAEDSFLLLDTLSSPSEIRYLKERFSTSQGHITTVPLVLELGTGSGVVLAFINAHARVLFGRDVLTLGIDVNRYACQATQETVVRAVQHEISVRKNEEPFSAFLGAVQGDLTASIRRRTVDLLVFNPPYVPTDELPDAPTPEKLENSSKGTKESFEANSHLLALSYAGGKDGMEVTERLLSQLPDVLDHRGVAYILLCHGNKPELVMDRIRNWGPEWLVEIVGQSGKMGGWEKLQIIRISRNI